jgi:hypothetical protein
MKRYLFSGFLISMVHLNSIALQTSIIKSMDPVEWIFTLLPFEVFQQSESNHEQEVHDVPFKKPGILAKRKKRTQKLKFQGLDPHIMKPIVAVQALSTWKTKTDAEMDALEKRVKDVTAEWNKQLKQDFSSKWPKEIDVLNQRLRTLHKRFRGNFAFKLNHEKFDDWTLDNYQLFVQSFVAEDEAWAQQIGSSGNPKPTV